MNTELMARTYELAKFALAECGNVGDDARCDLANKIERLIDEYLDYYHRHQDDE
jgi:hypothetical protein